MDKDGYHSHEVSAQTKQNIRNETIDEIIRELEKFTFAFGADTVSSFVVFIKGMKDD
jgi:hypothetical protein